MLINPYISFPAAGGGGGLTIPASAIYFARSYDFTWADDTRIVNGATNQVSGGMSPDPLSITGAMYGAPGHGLIKPGDQSGIYFELAGLDGSDRHLAIAYRILPFAATNGMLLGTSNASAYLGVGTNGSGSSADSTATRDAVRLNDTDYSGAMTRGDVWTGAEFADNDSPTNPEDVKFFAYENPTWGSNTFRPFFYTTTSFVPKAAIMGIAIFTDWGDLDDMQAALATLDTEAGYRYWRFRCTLNDGDGTGRVSIAALDFKDASGGVLTDATHGISNSYAKSAFSQGSTHYPSNLFDGNNSTVWTSFGSCAAEDGEWVTYDFGTGQDPAVASVDIRSTASAAGFAPNTFVIEKSQDGRNWTEVRSVSGETGWTSGGETRSFDLASPFSP